jgi:hypothetical protein
MRGAGDPSMRRDALSLGSKDKNRSQANDPERYFFTAQLSLNAHPMAVVVP